MAASMYAAQNCEPGAVNPSSPSVVLENDGYYWFLYPYFERANLDRRTELIDIYGRGEIEGYQMDRLEDEMKSVLEDLYGKPDHWQVLTGWNGTQDRAHEIWEPVDKSTVTEIIEQILRLIAYARDQRLKLVVVGD